MFDPRPLLEAKQLDLQRRVSNREAIEIEKSADEMDHIISLCERDVATITIDKQAALLRQVQAALQRYDHGEYGICMECEEQINEKRLRALPWASHCVQCQEKIDLNKLRTALDKDDDDE